MGTHIRVAALVTLILGVCSINTGEAQSPDERVKLEVRAAWDQYLQAFADGRADVIATRSYLTPSFSLVGSTGTSISRAPAEIEARFRASILALAGQNYARTETRAANICVLNEAAAVMSGIFTRYRKDGSVLAELAGTYVFAKTGDSWRIAAQIAHQPDRVLTCGT